MPVVRRLPLLLLGALLLGGVAHAQQGPGPDLVPPIPAAPADSPKVTVQPTTAAAPTAPGAKASRPAAAGQAKVPMIGRASIVRMFARLNPMIWLLALCSVATLGFAFERLVALRRERVIPHEFVTRFIDRLSSGKLDRDRAAELCRANDSPVARIFGMIISHWGQSAASLRQAVGHNGAGEVLELKRNVRVLNGTATLAPLLGLLGTVIGMIQSFEALGGRVGQAKGEALAQGISLALGTTAFGLGIAAISVVAYYYLLNRVDILVRELDEHARQVIDLVCAESIRPAATERRSTMPPPSDLARHESRVH